MEWFFHTRLWRRMHGHDDDGETGVYNGIAEQGFAGIGAWILGRNVFGPVRGPWPDDSWKGLWGDEPPYHTPVFVLTHHPRAPLRMAGGYGVSLCQRTYAMSGTGAVGSAVSVPRTPRREILRLSHCPKRRSEQPNDCIHLSISGSIRAFLCAVFDRHVSVLNCGTVRGGTAQAA